MFERNPEFRIAIMQAADEARELGHDQIGTDHLLLALMSNVRGTAFDALFDNGLSYGSARERVVAFHHNQPAAEAAKDESSSYDDDREALNSIGIDLDSIARQVNSRFGEDISEGWGRREGGRRGRREGGRGAGRPDFDRDFGPDFAANFGAGFGPGHRGRGRRGPHSRRFGGRFGMTDAAQHAIRGIFEDMREAHTQAAQRGERPDREQFRSALNGSRLLLSIIDAPDAAADAVLAGATDRAALRQAVLESLGTPVS